MVDRTKVFLTQGVDEMTTLEEALNSMKILFYV
jgi:hypothetical protein